MRISYGEKYLKLLVNANPAQLTLSSRTWNLHSWRHGEWSSSDLGRLSSAWLLLHERWGSRSWTSASDSAQLYDLQTKQQHQICIRFSTTIWSTNQTTASNLHQIQHNHVPYKPNNSIKSASDSAQSHDLQTKQHIQIRFSTIIWPTNQITVLYLHLNQHNHVTYKPNNSFKSTSESAQSCDLQTKQQHQIHIRISTTILPTNQITVLHLHRIQHNHMTYKPDNSITSASDFAQSYDLQTKQHHICIKIQHNHMTYKPNNGVKALVPLLHDAR